MEKQATCEERIGGHLKGRLEDMAAFVAVAGGTGTPEQREAIDVDPPTLDDDGETVIEDGGEEDAQERWSEYPLCVEVKRLLVVDLSMGGPADRFEVTLGEDCNPEAIVYFFQDWFDGAQRSLSGEEFDTAWAFLSWFDMA